MSRFTISKIGVVLLLSMLSGCSKTHWTDASTTVKPNSSASGPIAKISKPTDPTKMYRNVISYQYVPVPVPGQLMAMPSFKDIKKNAKGKEAVNLANKQALQKPKLDQYFNAMLTYAYMPGAVYTIYTSAGKITDITLETGEKIVNVAVGDSANWQIQTASSGKDENLTMHVLVKPMINDISDNTMVILTQTRTYHLYMKMTTNDTFMVAVNWNYPNKDGSMFLTAKDKSHVEQNIDVIDPGEASFNYQWAATDDKKPDWFPVEIFHTHTKTYIRFPKDFNDQTEMPILYSPDGNGGMSTMNNWRLIHKNTMVIEGVLKSGSLQTGSVKGKRSEVMIRINPHAKS